MHSFYDIKEKNAYDAVLDFLKTARKSSLQSNGKNLSLICWESFTGKLKEADLQPEFSKAIELWALENLDLHSPKSVKMRELHEIESLSISQEAHGKLMEAMRQGMITQPQSEELIESMMENESNTPGDSVEMEENLIRLWKANALKYKDIKIN